ncbi:MAG: hypothetical protein U0Q12_19185 [Vicinamibacterales bacterium]
MRAAIAELPAHAAPGLLVFERPVERPRCERCHAREAWCRTGHTLETVSHLCYECWRMVAPAAQGSGEKSGAATWTVVPAVDAERPLERQTLLDLVPLSRPPLRLGERAEHANKYRSFASRRRRAQMAARTLLDL